MESRLLAYSPPSWKAFFNDKITRYLIRNIDQKLEEESAIIIPKLEERFSAFYMTPLDKVHVVLVGMDPYPAEGMACGMSFSSWQKDKIPASLKNIYSRAEQTVKHFKTPSDSNLTHWASQGVLLLNFALTFPKGGKSGAHIPMWSAFTKHLIQYICNERSRVVFILWGGEAKKVSKLITKKHKILTSHHPSPLSVNRSKADNNPDHFMNNDHFNEANKALEEKGYETINWVFPDTFCDDSKLLFFDIETTGLSRKKDNITTIVWFYDGKVKHWYYGQDNTDFIKDWYDSDTVVGYNSATFDEPFIIEKFGLPLKDNHVDLMKKFREDGITGGLKNIAKLYNVYRPNDVGDIDGGEAAFVGKDIVKGKTKRLKELLYYNFWDVKETYLLYCEYYKVKPNSYEWDN